MVVCLPAIIIIIVMAMVNELTILTIACLLVTLQAQHLSRSSTMVATAFSHTHSLYTVYGTQQYPLPIQILPPDSQLFSFSSSPIYLTFPPEFQNHPLFNPRSPAKTQTTSIIL
ncbi:hypothetical protein I7I50_08672 [Histoplasma capsulatum G186AR]|uniref:Uncharacterized protein n=1 Tax=Ajellomyces capsulatus TaxID=5037 RepID=A0A8H7YQF7_AJECA|nr:hypothetical protein I7I52_06186 [Histoplasma capsulatum]QSS73774.1 hypothetical protein I7I50_08672 [Histoplasma capsulatum G186AR]